ncbi:MAG: hypothetical protein CNLJKLNK_00199 [Holosporales bacterium]
MLIQHSQQSVLWDGAHSKRLLPCAIGKNGFVHAAQKKEGDGKTPTGAYHLLSVYYRPDRVQRPTTQLPVHEIEPHFLWCDDPLHPLYNQLMESENDAKSYEHLYRAPCVYDILITTNHNTNPTHPFAGSAIFIHCTDNEPFPYTPSRGCLKLQKEDILFILESATLDTQWIIPDSMC